MAEASWGRANAVPRPLVTVAVSIFAGLIFGIAGCRDANQSSTEEPATTVQTAQETAVETPTTQAPSAGDEATTLSFDPNSDPAPTEVEDLHAQLIGSRVRIDYAFSGDGKIKLLVAGVNPVQNEVVAENGRWVGAPISGTVYLPKPSIEGPYTAALFAYGPNGDVVPSRRVPVDDG